MPRPIHDPSLLDDLAAEADSIAASTTKFLRLTLEQGEEAIVRLLPAKIAGNKFYAKIAKHWLKRSNVIVCPRGTDKALGGDPEAPCECCDVYDDLRNHATQQVADRAYKSGAQPLYTMFVKVIETKARSYRETNANSAHELSLYRGTMDDFIALYRRYAGRNVFLDDPVEGYDLIVRRGRKGTKIEIDQRAPLFEGADAEKKLKSLIGTINFKAPAMPDSKAIRKFAAQIEDYCYSNDDDDDDDKGRGDRGDRGRSRSKDDFDEDTAKDEPRRGRREEEPAPRGRREEEPAPRGRRREEDEAPAPRGRREEEPVAQRGRREEEAPAPRRSRNEDTAPGGDDEIPGLESPPPRRAVSPPPAARRAPEPPASRRSAEDSDEEGDAAEERHDTIPPETPNADDESPADGVVEPPPRPSRLRDRIAGTR